MPAYASSSGVLYDELNSNRERESVCCGTYHSLVWLTHLLRSNAYAMRHSHALHSFYMEILLSHELPDEMRYSNHLEHTEIPRNFFLRCPPTANADAPREAMDCGWPKWKKKGKNKHKNCAREFLRKLKMVITFVENGRCTFDVCRLQKT